MSKSSEHNTNIGFKTMFFPSTITIFNPVNSVYTYRQSSFVSGVFDIPVDIVVVADQPAVLLVELRLELEVAVDAYEVSH